MNILMLGYWLPNGKTQKQPERYLEARYYENQLLFLKLSELKLNFEL